MAKSVKDSHSIIRDAFSPVVGILCSEDADAMCRKNSLSFVEMLQPFCRLTTEAHIRDVNNSTNTLTEFRVIMKDTNVPSPQPVLGMRMLNNAVSRITTETKDKWVAIGSTRVQYSGSTPWYEEYRECFFAIAHPSDHEYLKHYCACIYVVSSADDEPLDRFQRMADGPLQLSAKHPKWFSGEILRYFLLLHDVVSGDESRAEAVYQSTKAKYGAQACHLLKINSVPSQLNGSALSNETVMTANPWNIYLKRRYTSSESSLSPEPADLGSDGSFPDGVIGNSKDATIDACEGAALQHPLSAESMNNDRHAAVFVGSRLSPSDQDRLRIFVREFIVRALVPWAERSIRMLTELCHSKKSMNRGIFKKWFNTKPNEKPSDVVSYAQDSVEMQQRRLGDLCFMFQLYDASYQMYHSLKKDFEADKAFMFSAGVQELASLSIFMQGEKTQRQYPVHYMEAAINTYWTTCRSEHFAMRSTMLHAEALKSKGQWMQASACLLKMCSEDASLRSALLLEQAAYCHVGGQVGARVALYARKFSWYLVLAGERYARAGQNRHALRCLTTALQSHQERGWTLAQDYINSICGRLCGSAEGSTDHELAFTFLACLLHDSSGQTAAQQDAYLREFLAFFQQMEEAKPDQLPPVLPVPNVVANDVVVLTCRYEGDGHLEPETVEDPVYAPQEGWHDLEAALLKSSKVVNSAAGSFSPCFTQNTNNSVNPVVLMGETMTIRIRLHNPLLVPLLLSDVRLLWRFTHDDGRGIVTNERRTTASVDAHMAVEEFPILNLVLDSEASNYVEFCLCPMATGLLVVVGVQYKLGRVALDLTSKDEVRVSGRKELVVCGRRLNLTKADLLSKKYAPDKRLEIVVGLAAPKLKVSFKNFPENLMCGELREVIVRMTNVGPVPLHRIRLACSDASNVCFAPSSSAAGYELPSSGAHSDLVGHHRHPLVVCDHVPLPGDGQLAPSQSAEFVMWLRGSDEVGTFHRINFVFCYGARAAAPIVPIGLAAPSDGPVRWRFSRHSFAVTREKSLSLGACARSWGLANSAPSLATRLVMVDVENRCQQSQEKMIEFNITQMDFYSSQWDVVPIHSFNQAALRVNLGEVALFCLKALRRWPPPDVVADGAGIPRGGKLAMHSSLLRPKQANALFGSASGECCLTANHLVRQFAERRADGSSLNAVESSASYFDAAASAEGDNSAAAMALAEASNVKSVLAVLWQACTIMATGETRDSLGIHLVPVRLDDDGGAAVLSSEGTVYAGSKVELPAGVSQRIASPVHDSSQLAVRAVGPGVPASTPTNIVRCQYQHPSRVEAHFSKQRFCTVPVKLLLENLAYEDVVLEVSKRPSSVDFGGGMQWSGKLQGKLKLKARAHVELCLLATFASEGTFSLNTLDIKAALCKENPVFAVQKDVSPALIIVSDSGSANG